MDTIAIQSTQNVDSVSALYHELYKNRSGECSIRIATDLSDYRMGGKGELIQFLLTWADKFPDAPIVTYIPPGSTNEVASKFLKNLFSQEHGFVLALRARRWGLEVQRTFADAKQSPLPGDLVEAALYGSDIFIEGEPLLKHLRFFIAVDDHIERGNSILQDYTRLYLRRSVARSPMKMHFSSQLKLLFHRQTLLKTQVPIPNPVAINTFIETVTRFVYEIFENAGRWGTKDHGNSVRGILLHLHAREVRSSKSLQSQVGANNPLSSFLSHFQLGDGYENTSFLEITIFDNGPTLARHLLKRAPKNITEELKATRKCLLLSSGRSPKSNEGQGLYDTIKLIHHCRGLIKYRGNRLSVFRDFIKDPIAEVKLQELEATPREKRESLMLDLLFMRDWSTQNKTPEVHPVAVGSLFTIIVPVKEINQ